MNCIARLRSHKTKLVLLVMFLLSGGVSAVVSQDEDTSKAIKAEEFVTKRPAKSKQPSTAKYRATVKGADKAADAPPTGAALDDIGITIWRLRPTTTGDKTKELVEEDGEEVTLERVREGTPVAIGQRIRLSIESLSRDGLLYVIDREQYDDGTFGDPILIFPNQKTAGANTVRAGKLIYIPSAASRFRIKASDSVKKHVAEVITIIVAPRPLISDDQLGFKSTRLRRDQVDSWQKQWGTVATKFEMEGGAGQAMTLKEQSAAAQNSPLLTQDDPVPQTVYRVAIRPDNPLLVNVPLKFAREN